MRTFPPAFEDRHYLVPVVVRTDYSDDRAWRGVTDRAGQCFAIQGAQWDGATVEDVLLVATTHPVLAVVFLADAAAMASDGRLLAVTTTTPDDDAYDDTVRFGREFRAAPGDVRGIHVSLETLTATFADHARRMT